mmetsp:Transcript_1520/g.6013  ORF Transcript_1520/g.6013 Transcript_1520/m.6013 type:complete len:222 (+) Transcript_1520:1151-1816(+)
MVFLVSPFLFAPLAARVLVTAASSSRAAKSSSPTPACRLCPSDLGSARQVHAHERPDGLLAQGAAGHPPAARGAQTEVPAVGARVRGSFVQANDALPHSNRSEIRGRRVCRKVDAFQKRRRLNYGDQARVGQPLDLAKPLGLPVKQGQRVCTDYLVQAKLRERRFKVVDSRLGHANRGWTGGRRRSRRSCSRSAGDGAVVSRGGRPLAWWGDAACAKVKPL